MTSTLAMTSGRRHSKLRLPTNIPPCEEDFILTGGSSGSPLITPNTSNNPLDKVFKLDSKMDGDDNNNNNRSASAFLSKLLDGKDLYNDLDGSPSPTCHDSDSFVPSKSTSSRMSAQKLSASQRKNSRPSTVIRHKPAEVFRKDLISAMKIPDTSQLLCEEYWVMQDPWRIEWEKGVQVPVNPKSIPTKNVRIVPKETQGGFRMPRKMLKSSPEPGDKDMVDLNVLADSACRYDLDEMDVHWLEEINEERSIRGLMSLDEFSMEQIMEELETQCHENMQVAIQTKEGLGIEYDEDVVCDVCRMPDCEEGNEMVFCDGCNLCVHQACYGILKVPDGNWLCRPCSLGIRGSAVCILCDRKGGAMKSTRSGNKWAHVSCALWIPEISIADPERMEPITKVSHVPASRWALLCSICKERVGACIQCSVKHCVTAYHVTCAVEEKLDMIADCTDENAEDAVIFRSFCKKHSKNRKESISDQDEEEKRNLRQRRIMELEEEFYTLVKDEAVANALSVPVETVQEVMAYWKLKRKINFDRALITPKHEEGTALAEAAESNLQRRLRMFTHLRQDLERVRNLCYMIGRREKTKRASVKNMESVFLTQMKLLERRMCHDTHFSTQRMASGLAKFGQPEVCKLAQREWKTLSLNPEWMPLDVLSDTPVDVKRGRRPAADIESTPSPVDTNASISQLPTDKPAASNASQMKNGLHRKAFLSACQRRESLGLKRTVGQAEEAKPRAETRKRSLKSNSDSDFESENKRPLANKRLDKRAKTWSVWRTKTKSAGMSPSAFTVKTEEDQGKEVEAQSYLSERGSRSRSSRLSARANSNTEQTESPGDTKRPVQRRNALGSSPRKPPEPDLVVKWEEDKVDDPKLVTNKSRSPLPNGQVAKRAKPDSNGNTKRPVHSKQVVSPVPSPSSNVSTRSGSKKNVRTVPARRAATEAKNEPGALARSCDSDVGAEDAVSRGQGLRKSPRTSPQNDDSPPHPDVLVDTNNLPRPQKRSSGVRPDDEEEDGGYKGDMDESDSETPAPSVGRHKLTQLATKRSSHSMQKRTARGYSDTAESSDYTSFSEYDKTSLAKRRRLRSLHRLQNKSDACEVRFKGYKDVLDDALPSPDRKAETSEPVAEETAKWPKNELAVGDVCDEEVAVDGQHSIAGGPTLPHSSNHPPHPANFLPAAVSGYPGEPPFFQPGLYPANSQVLPPDLYYSNVYARRGDWTLTPKHKLIYAQQFARPTLHQSGYPPDHFPPPQHFHEDMLSHSHVGLPVQPDQHHAPFVQLPPQVVVATEEVEPEVALHTHAKTHKKKKSKKSKRKKKKKRKRRESFASVSASSDHSGSSAEYCVEYCSVLTEPSVGQQADTSAAVESPHSSDNYDATAIDVPSREVELSQSGNDILNTSGQTNTSFVSSEQPTPTKQGGLLLKIDRKRLILPQKSDSESDNSNSSREERSYLDEKDDDDPQPAPFVTPLKLKLSVQKSDRALRSGLMPRCYEILDDSGTGVSQEATLSEEEQPEINTETEVQSKRTRAQAALRRLGLINEDANTSLGAEKVISSDSIPRVDPDGSALAQNLPVRKRGRPRKKLSPKDAQVAIITTETNVQGILNSRSASTDTRSIPEIPVRADVTPVRVRSHSDVIVSEMTSPNAGSSASAQPERHWKKRKVKEHVESVAVEPAPFQLPEPTAPDVPVTSSNIRHHVQPPPEPVQVPTFSTPPSVATKPIIADNNELVGIPENNQAQNQLKSVLSARTSVNRSAPVNDTYKRPSPKPAKKKSTSDHVTDSRKNSGKIVDGLPPVAPYRFTKANTHQQKMCNRASGTSVPGVGARDKTAAFNMLRARRKAEAGGQTQAKKIAPTKADPYEFADFGS